MLGLSPLVPAYGRTYKSAKEATEAFCSGKDWVTPMGQLISIRDFIRLKIDTVELRYGVRREKAVIAEIDHYE